MIDSPMPTENPGNQSYDDGDTYVELSYDFACEVASRQMTQRVQQLPATQQDDPLLLSGEAFTVAQTYAPATTQGILKALMAQPEILDRSSTFVILGVNLRDILREALVHAMAGQLLESHGVLLHLDQKKAGA